MFSKNSAIFALLAFFLPAIVWQFIYATNIFANSPISSPISSPASPSPAPISIPVTPKPSPTPTTSPQPSNLVLIKGTVLNAANTFPAFGATGKTIETCLPSTITRPVVDQNGNFSFSITKGQTFCLRAPNLTSYGYTKPNSVNRSLTATSTTSYEWQVAGYDCAGIDKSKSVCQYNDKIRNDRALNSGYNFAYAYSNTDQDRDGFSDGVENFTGTNAAVACGINAWIPDFNNDKQVTTVDYNLFLTAITNYMSNRLYNNRYDLNADGTIDIKDFSIFRTFWGKICN